MSDPGFLEGVSLEKEIRKLVTPDFYPDLPTEAVSFTSYFNNVLANKIESATTMSQRSFVNILATQGQFYFI